MRCLIVFLLVACILPTIVLADELQVWVKPTAHFQQGDNVTFGGMALDDSGNALSGRNITAQVIDPSGDSTTLHAHNLLTDSDGKFTTDVFTSTSELGTYTVVVELMNQNPLMPPTIGYAFFYVEQSRQYKVTTNKYIYDAGENVTITVTVEDVYANGTKAPALASVPLKVFREDGTLVIDRPLLSTSSSGSASVVYTLPTSSDVYATYIIDVYSGKTSAAFKVPFFKVDVKLLNELAGETSKYTTSNNLSVRVTASKESSDGSVSPVSGVQITAQLKSNAEDNAGTIYVTYSATDFTYISGVYTSSSKSLGSLPSGKYYVDVTATKTNSVKASKYLSVSSLDLDLEPIFPTSEVTAFLKNDGADIGIRLVNLKTGELYASNQVTDAKIIACKKDSKDCLSMLQGFGSAAESTDSGFSKLLHFTTPNSEGNYELKVRVNTSTSYVEDSVFITVQGLFSTASIQDRFANMKWKVKSGESLTFDTQTWLSSNLQSVVNRVSVVGCTDSEGSDVTSQMTSTEGNSSSGSDIELSAPSSGGCYTCNLMVESQNGTSYTTDQVCVQKYDIWIASKKLQDSQWMWEWRFPSTASAYLHVQVMNDAGQTVAASKLAIELTKLTNLLTGQSYSSPSHSVLPLTSAGYAIVNATAGARGQQIINLSLAALGLASGFYEATIQVSDDEGSVDTAKGFFQVSDLDVDVRTLRSGSRAFLFKPTDNIYLNVSARYFNNSIITGASVSVDRLLLISGSSPKTISTDIYTSTTNTTSEGVAMLRLKAKSGQQLPSGDYLAFVKVTKGSVTETREAWFMVKPFFLYAYTIPYFYAAPSTATSIYGFASDPDFNPIANVNISFEAFYDARQFNPVKGISAPSVKTDSFGSFQLVLNSSPATEGPYVYVIDAVDSSSGAAVEYMDFLEVKSYANVECTLVDRTQSAVNPSSSVSYKITVTDSDSAGISNLNISVSKFTNVETWTDRSATTTSSGVTNSEGVATVTLTAPTSIGRYRPIITINGNELSSDTYAYGTWPCEIGVYQTEVNLQLQNKQAVATTSFVPGQNISVNFLLSNPAGGSISMSELKLVQYECLTPSCKTGSPPYTATLGSKKTSNFAASNIMKFSAPQKKGTYMLVTQATDSNSNIKSIPATFNVVDAAFNYYVSIANPTVALGFPVMFRIDTDGEIKVNMTGLRNIGTQAAISPGASQNTFAAAKGQLYNYSTSSLASGTYEATICAYTSTCTAASNRLRFVFSVISGYYPMARPFKPTGSYGASSNITLEARLENSTGQPVGISLQNMSVVSIRKAGKEYRQLFTVAKSDSPIPGWKLLNMKPVSALEAGDYEATIVMNYSGSSFSAYTHFMVTQYNFKVVTSDGKQLDSAGFMVPSYAVGNQVTFNITGAANKNGSLYIFDVNGWVMRSQHTTQFVLNANGFAQVQRTFTSSGNLVAVAAIPNIQVPGHLEAHYPFDIRGGFDVNMNWHSMHPEIGTGDNLLVNFTVVDASWQPVNSGKMNATISKYYSPFNWNVLNSSVGITVGDIGIGSDGVATFSFNPNVAIGEYMAEIVFRQGAIQVTRHVWFRVKSADFWAWTDMPSYKPGETVNVRASLRSSVGSGMQGEQLKIMSVARQSIPLAGSYLTASQAVTDSSGEAILAFTLPKDQTGKFIATINWTNTSEIRTITVQSSTYNIEVFDKTFPPYSVGDHAKLEVIIRDASNNPVSGVYVNYTVKSEAGNWQVLTSNANAGTTDATGKVTIDYTIPASANGFCDMEIDIGGYAKRYRGFYVSIFDVFAGIRGERVGDSTSYKDYEIPSDATVVVSIDAKQVNGTALANANVSLVSVFRMSEYNQINVSNLITRVTTRSITSSTGSAELRFGVANLTSNKDYDVEIRVKSGTSESFVHRWFRISGYKWRARFVAPPDLADTSGYDLDSRGAGERAFIRVNISGYDSTTRVCLDRIENINNRQNYWIGKCYGFQKLNASNGIVRFNFTSPIESGNYQAVVELRSYKSETNWIFLKDNRLQFEVLGGAAADYQFNVWTESPNVWQQQNSTIHVELWQRNQWGSNINEASVCGNISITEIRDVQTWAAVQTSADIEQSVGASGIHDSSTPLTFKVPSLPAREYMAKVRCANLGLEREAWFRISSFQVAVLMPESVMMNQNVSFWAKITYYNGTPLSNVNITVVEITNNWAGGRIEKSINSRFLTDSNGEIISSFIAPQNTGEYDFVLQVTDGVDTQKISKWFRISAMNVDVVVARGRYTIFEGEDNSVTVTVSNAQTGAPLRDARVELNMFRHMYEGGESVDQSFVNCSAQNASSNCLHDDNCYWDEPACISFQDLCSPLDDNSCLAQPDYCWFDYGFSSCRPSEKGQAFNQGSIHGEVFTNYNGIATFDFSGSKALAKGEYEVDVNVDGRELGWFSSHKSFVVRRLNLTLSTSQLTYQPGDTIGVDITARYSNGTPVHGRYTVMASLEEPDFAKQEQMMACNMKLDNSSCSSDANCNWQSFNQPSQDCSIISEPECNALPCIWFDSSCEDCSICQSSPEQPWCQNCGQPQEMPPVPMGSDGWCMLKPVLYTQVSDIGFVSGVASFNLTLPLNASAGPAMLITDIEDNTSCTVYPEGERKCSAVEFLDAMIYVFDNETSDITIAVDNPVVGAHQFISVNITLADAADANRLAIAPMVRHMQSAGGVIPMQEMMGGGPESGKEDWYYGQIYLNPDGVTHMMLLSRNKPADYVAMIPLQQKGASFTMGKNFNNVLATLYTVNSSAGECERNFDCNDNNNQTWDICVLMQCRHKNTSQMQCTSDYECKNYAGLGVYGICDWTGTCVNITGNCASDSDCSDADPNNYDFCEYYKCRHESSTNLQCTQASQCTSYPGANYTAFCEYGKCQYLSSSHVGCASDSDCSQGEWCDMADHQCHYDKGGNCECMSSDNCTAAPYGASTLAQCWCQCQYLNASDLDWLYSWNTTRDAFGNATGVSWNYGEMADEAHPFGGNPGADIVRALVANDSNYLYLQLRLGGVKWGGGLPYCGGSYSSSGNGLIKGQKYSVFFDTKSGGSNGSVAGADYRQDVFFTQVASYVASYVYRWNSTLSSWQSISNVLVPDVDFDHAVECLTSSIDFMVKKSVIEMSANSRVIIASYMTSNETYASSWIWQMCNQNGCSEERFYAGNLSSLIDRVPNSGWQWTNDTGAAESEMGPPPEGDVCGDGNVTGPEQCDDGAAESGDGCSNVCTVEPGCSCVGDPSVCGEDNCVDTVDNDNDGFADCADSDCSGAPECSPGPQLFVSIIEPGSLAQINSSSVFVLYNITGNLSEYNHTKVKVDNGAIWSVVSYDVLGVHNVTLEGVSSGEHNIIVELRRSANIISDANVSVIVAAGSPAGLSGQVNGSVIEDAMITVMNSSNSQIVAVVNTTQTGTYNTALLPGVYDAVVNLPNSYQYSSIMVRVNNINVSGSDVMNVRIPHISGMARLNGLPVIGLTQIPNGSESNFSIWINNSALFMVNVSLDFNASQVGDLGSYQFEYSEVPAESVRSIMYTFTPSVVGPGSLVFNLWMAMPAANVITGTLANPSLAVWTKLMNVPVNITLALPPGSCTGTILGGCANIPDAFACSQTSGVCTWSGSCTGSGLACDDIMNSGLCTGMSCTWG